MIEPIAINPIRPFPLDPPSQPSWPAPSNPPHARGPAIPPRPSQSQPRPISPASSSLQPANSRERIPRRSGLAQPLNPNWGAAYDAAVQERRVTKTLKDQQQEMEAQKKRTCLLIVWHTVRVHLSFLRTRHLLLMQNGMKPLRLTHEVETYPQLRLSASSDLIDDLKLTADSRIDIWRGEWMIIKVKDVIDVDRGQHILLRIRPSLLEELTDCPGLTEELALQPKRWRTGKRGGDESVSPLKKAARHPEISSVVAMRPTPDAGGHLQTPFSKTQLPRARSPSVSTSIRHDSSDQPRVRGSRLQSPSIATSSSFQSQSIRGARTRAKVWPLDYYVHEISIGLKDIARLQARGATMPDAFRQTFPGFEKFPRTTFYKYRREWPLIDKELRDRFIERGHSSQALFRQLLKAADMSDISPSPSRSPSPSPSSPQSSPLPQPKPLNASLRPSTRSSSPWSRSLSPPCPSRPPPLLVTTVASSGDTSYPDSSGIDTALCEFCDQPMPSPLSAKLIAMRSDLESRTWPEPTEDNPKARSAKSFQVYISYCTRHRLEKTYLPEAKRNGWPITIDFANLSSRVVALRDVLEELMMDPFESEFFEHARDASRSKGKGKNMEHFMAQSAG